MCIYIRLISTILNALTRHTVGTPAATLAILLPKEIHINEAIVLSVHFERILQLFKALYWYVLRHRAFSVAIAVAVAAIPIGDGGLFGCFVCCCDKFLSI